MTMLSSTSLQQGHPAVAWEKCRTESAVTLASNPTWCLQS